MKILLWERRQEKGVSILQLAKLTGISKNTLYRIENEEYYPSADKLEKIAIALHVRITQLIESDYI